MKKNKTMRVATLLLALALITSCFVGGTLAKYTSSADSQDSARVAKWGFTPETMDLSGLFKNAYNGNGDESVKSEDKADVIAPGTTNSATFAFKYSESDTTANAPEVAYNFTVSTDGSEIDESIKANTNIQWKLDNGKWGTWDELMASIKALSGDASGSKDYAPNTLPAAFTKDDDVHTVAWQWVFESAATDENPDLTAKQDKTDTAMGNSDPLDSVVLKITVTATQLDTYNG